MAQCRTCGRPVITRVTAACTTTGDGGDNPGGDRYLADAIITRISDVHVTCIMNMISVSTATEKSKIT